MTAKADTLQALHGRYCVLTERPAKFGTFERMWWGFDQAGYSLDDLTISLRFMLWENKAGRHDWKYSIGLSSLIGDLPRFDDILNKAKTHYRRQVKPPTNREQVLSAFRKAPEQQKEQVCQSVKDLLRKVIEQ